MDVQLGASTSQRAKKPIWIPLHHTVHPQVTLAAQGMDPSPCHGPPSFQLGLHTLSHPLPSLPTHEWMHENLANHPRTTSLPRVS